MPKPQSSCRSKAPPSKTYASEPKLQQLRFPPRNRFSVPSTRRSSSEQSLNQSTLTQIDFARIMSDTDKESIDNAQVLSEEEKESGRARKKRKIATFTETKKHQSTLTQIGFVQPEVLSDEEVESDSGRGAQLEIVDSEDESDSQFHCDDGLNIKEEEDQTVIPTSKTFSASAKGLCQQEHLPCKKEDSQVSINRPPQSQIFKTPQKPIKREIPSSRSPSASPLTPYNASPLKHERTPLKEIPFNIMAKRDSEPYDKIKAEPMSSTSHELESAELGVDDRENHEPSPCSTVKVCSYTSERIHAFALQEHVESSTRNFTRLKQPDFSTVVKCDKAMNCSGGATTHDSTIVRSSQATTVDLTQSSPKMDFVRSPILSHSNNQNQQALASLDPLDEESQFLIFTDDLGPYSPLSSVQDTQDIITVNQLLPASMMDD